MDTKKTSNDTAYIHRSFKRIKNNNPELGEMLDTFEGLAVKRAQIRIDLGSMENQYDFSIDPLSLAKGIPVFHDLKTSGFNEEFSKVAKTLYPFLAIAFKPIAKSINIISKKLDDGNLDIQEYIDTILSNDSLKLEKLGESIKISPETLHFIMSQTIKIIFENKRSGIGESSDIESWRKGYCPLCGAFPDISFLRTGNTEPEKSEFLKAHGARLWLHCSQCSHEWQIKRSLCAYCNNEETKAQEYFSIKNNVKERVYTCKHCKKYIACIDEREDIEPNHPEAVAVGAVPLYIIAQKKGFFPMVNTPLNTIGT